MTDGFDIAVAIIVGAIIVATAINSQTKYFKTRDELEDHRARCPVCRDIYHGVKDPETFEPVKSSEVATDAG